MAMCDVRRMRSEDVEEMWNTVMKALKRGAMVHMSDGRWFVSYDNGTWRFESSIILPQDLSIRHGLIFYEFYPDTRKHPLLRFDGGVQNNDAEERHRYPYRPEIVADYIGIIEHRGAVGNRIGTFLREQPRQPERHTHERREPWWKFW